MSCLSIEVKRELAELVSSISMVDGPCPCCSYFTGIIHPKCLVCEFDDRIVWDVEMVHHQCKTGANFWQDGLQCPRCTHDPVRSFPLHIRIEDDEILRSNEKVVLYRAKNLLTSRTPCVDARDLFSGVMPADGGSARSPQQSVILAELFCGGFSGWSHVNRTLVDLGVPIQHAWSLDIDNVALQTYVRTHSDFVMIRDCKEAKMNKDQDGGNPSYRKVAIQSDVRLGWFLSHLPCAQTDVLLMSPPCPPWSFAAKARGLHVAEGRTFVYAWGLIAVLRPAVVAIEEVASMIQHSQWPLLRKAIEWAGYRIIASESINLNQVLPQNRNRVIMLAVDCHANDIARAFQWVHWPVGRPLTLATSKCILQHDKVRYEEVVPDQETIGMYLDPAMLPKGDQEGIKKKTKKEVRLYRIRELHHESVACIMANYGKGHRLPKEVLQQGGLYGSFIMQANTIRFLTIEEITMLMGVIHETYLPDFGNVATHLVGNGISTPHACIAILNALVAFKADILPSSIQEMFAQVVSERMTNENISSEKFGDFIRIYKNDDSMLQDESTIVMQSFITVWVKSPTSQIQYNIETGLPLLKSLEMLTGPSIPAQVELEVNGENRLAILSSDLAAVEPVVIRTNVPSVLHVDDKAFYTTTNSIIIALTCEGPILLKRQSGLIIREVTKTLHEFFPEIVSNNLIVCDPLGIQHDQECTCPDIIIMRSKKEAMTENDHNQVLKIKMLPSFTKENGYFKVKCTWSNAFKILRKYQSVGLIEGCKCLGWAVQILPTNGHDDGKILVQIAPLPGKLAVTQNQIEMYIATALSIAEFPEQRDARHPMYGDRCVHVKLWGQWVWKGFISPSQFVSVFLRPWENATLHLGEQTSLRAVWKGHQVFEHSAFTMEHDPNIVIKLFLVLQLHGGGNKEQAIQECKNKFAVFLLSKGADMHQTTHAADVLMRSAGLQTVNKMIALSDEHDRLSGLKKLCESLHIKWPDFPKGDEAKNQKIARNFRQSGRKITSPSADMLHLVPGTFTNEDGTETQIVSRVANGISGVCLLDPQAALPWIQEQREICSDEMAIVVLGHECPCKPSANCKQICIPALSAHDQSPLIITGCLHNLGQKHVTFKKEDQDQVKVEETAVIAVTTYRDELPDGEWSNTVSQPVKCALTALGIQEEDALAAPPWGRSWQHNGSKSDPKFATSIQFHARVLMSKLERFLKLSGRGGTYVAPKMDSNSADNRYAIVWVEHDPVSIAKLLVDIPSHLGPVRTMRGKGDNMKCSRGIRCKHVDFEAIFKKLKPLQELPDVRPVSKLYKIQPVPLGADQNAVTTWLKQQKIEARPIKALGHTAWLIGSTNPVSTQFLTWNGKAVMVKEIQSKHMNKQNAVMAGSLPRPRPSVSSSSSSTRAGTEDGVFNNDPWSKYTPTTAHKQPVNAAVSTFPRQVEAPIEARFAKQDEQITRLEHNVIQLQERLDKKDNDDRTFQQSIQKDITTVKHDVAEQIGIISKQFESSISRALKKQDDQMSSGFAELKQMLRMSNQPFAAKKAKVAPSGDKSGEMSVEEDGL